MYRPSGEIAGRPAFPVDVNCVTCRFSIESGAGRSLLEVHRRKYGRPNTSTRINNGKTLSARRRGLRRRRLGSSVATGAGGAGTDGADAGIGTADDGRGTPDRGRAIAPADAPAVEPCTESKDSSSPTIRRGVEARRSRFRSARISAAVR